MKGMFSMKKTSNRIGAVIASLAVISSAVSFSFTYDPLAYQNAMTANAVSLTAFPEPENKTLSTTSTAPQEITTTTTATYIPELRTTKAYVEGYKQYSVSATVTIMALDENSVTFENAITLENYGTFGFAGIDIYEQLAQYKVGDTVNIYFFYDLDSSDGSPVIQDINALYDYIPPVTTIQPDGESSATVTTTIAVWTRTEPADTTTATDGIYYDLPLEYDSSPMRIGETREIKYSAYYIHSIESTENISYELVENDRGEVEKILITALSEGDATLVVHQYDSVGIVNINVLSEDYVPPVTTTIATYTVLPEVTTTAVDDAPVTTVMGLETVVMGDSNGDGKVTLADAVAILQYIANREKYPLDEQAILVSDVCNNGDGISAYDALVIQWYDAKKITSLPINLDNTNK